METSLPRAIQFVETAHTYAEAEQMVGFLATQEGCLGARVIGDGSAKSFAAQALFEMEDEPAWLPDGCRVVVIPSGFLSRFQPGVAS